VQDVLEYLASGMSISEILEDFPYLTKEDILACLSFAARKDVSRFTDNETFDRPKSFSKIREAIK
jgi:uncharacterized protein (DUF433 family)